MYVMSDAVCVFEKKSQEKAHPLFRDHLYIYNILIYIIIWTHPALYCISKWHITVLLHFNVVGSELARRLIIQSNICKE